MGYRELGPPAGLRPLVETAWTADGDGECVRVLPDGCMDLIRTDGDVIVAGPDTIALTTRRSPEPMEGLRFRPGVLPRLLGVPASELIGARVSLDELGTPPSRARLPALAAELADRSPRRETAPWTMPTLRHVTARFAAGTPVAEVAREIGWSNRTLQRHCRAVYGYGPVTLRRILRFRRAVSMLQAGRPAADVAVQAGYADQPHLHRDLREFAGTGATALVHGQPSGANRSTEVPSGSSTVA
jgi:AraC-like DNA-binding protein